MLPTEISAHKPSGFIYKALKNDIKSYKSEKSLTAEKSKIKPYKKSFFSPFSKNNTNENSSYLKVNSPSYFDVSQRVGEKLEKLKLNPNNNKNLLYSNTQPSTNSNVNSKISSKLINYNITRIQTASNKKNKNNNTFLKKNKITDYNYHGKNAISFVDRNRIKHIGLVTLKLYENYIDEPNNMGEENKNKDHIAPISKNSHNNYNNFILNSIKDPTKTNIFGKFSNDISFSEISEKKLSNSDKKIRDGDLKKFNTKRKYGLKQLMELNPYHYVSSMVRYCNTIEMKKISEKLSTVRGATFNKKATTQYQFFKNKKSNNKCLNKVISCATVSFNDNLTHTAGFIWRILDKLKKTNVKSLFLQVCKYQGYSELWKYYSMLIQKLLVNYCEFKWFFEKKKLMSMEVFSEFLQCMKIEVKGDKTFPTKVFLLFDDNCTGEINMKLFFFIMDLTSKSNNDIDKINFISKILEDINLKNSENSINLIEMYDLFKNIIDHSSYKKTVRLLYEALKDEFNNGERIEKELYISKKQVCGFMMKNPVIQKIFQNFRKQYKYAYITYNEEVNSIFNSTVRTVKKFLNEQNGPNKLSINECYNFESVLQAVQFKNKVKDKIKIIENEFDNTEEKEEKENSSD